MFYFRKDKNVKLEREMQLKWFFRHLPTYSIIVKVNTMKFIKLSLFAVVLYFALKDFKILMVGGSDSRHVMSELVMAVRTALHPIEYSYPTILSIISESHINYV